ncbi:MAG: tripartite tricarboxylate transporter substrate binding protein [Rubrivivax sp.]|nr:tripartite tricarboxylate transporter substrate binding protein [Rubrivivax sp.]
MAAAVAQGFPNKTVRFVVPYPPGGGTSIVAQLLSHKLKDKWGQAVVVDNRPGASGIIGASDVLRSAADGHTLLLASSTHVINPLLMSTPYDSIKDFAPVLSLYSSELVLVVNPALPARNLQEFIALAKASPGKFNYASVSAGGTTHLAGEMLNVMAEIKTHHVAYKGAGPALTDLIGGQVEFSFAAPVAALPFITNGRLKALAVTGDARVPAIPQVPTFAEAGMPGFQARLWFGFIAKAGTPPALVDKLAADIGAVMDTPEMKERLLSLGLDRFVNGPEAYGALMKADLARYADLVKKANIKLEN